MSSTPPWRLRARLAAWHVVCAALLIGHAGWFIAMRIAPAPHQVVLIGGAALAVLIVLLAILLATTPPDALRLPRRRSELLILGGTVCLELTAAVVASTAPIERIALGVLTVLGITVMLLQCVRTMGRSAWIVALFAWNPLVIYQTGVAGRATGWPALLLVALVLLLLILAMRRDRIFPDFRTRP